MTRKQFMRLKKNLGGMPELKENFKNILKKNPEL